MALLYSEELFAMFVCMEPVILSMWAYAALNTKNPATKEIALRSLGLYRKYFQAELTEDMDTIHEMIAKHQETINRWEAKNRSIRDSTQKAANSGELASRN